MIDLVAANRLMDGMQYLAGPASENLYNHLLMAVRGLDDEVALPFWTEPYAWRRTYKIYRILKQRQANKPPDNAAMAAFSAAWSKYIQLRGEFFQLIRKDELSNTDALYLGLQPGDLDSPTTNDLDEQARYGVARHPKWRERADRIESALAKWESMTLAERASVPEKMMALRAEAKARGLEKRLVELESRGISNNRKEIEHV
jgi:hypothetical protein